MSKSTVLAGSKFHRNSIAQDTICDVHMEPVCRVETMQIEKLLSTEYSVRRDEDRASHGVSALGGAAATSLWHARPLREATRLSTMTVSLRSLPGQPSRHLPAHIAARVWMVCWEAPGEPRRRTGWRARGATPGGWEGGGWRRLTLKREEPPRRCRREGETSGAQSCGFQIKA